MFVAGDGLVERLTVCESAEVEGLTPTILVEICAEIVITGRSISLSSEYVDWWVSILSCEGCVFCFSSLEKGGELAFAYAMMRARNFPYTPLDPLQSHLLQPCYPNA